MVDLLLHKNLLFTNCNLFDSINLDARVWIGVRFNFYFLVQGGIMLKLENITKIYEGKNFKQIALNDVTLAFRNNEFDSERR